MLWALMALISYLSLFPPSCRCPRKRKDPNASGQSPAEEHQGCSAPGLSLHTSCPGCTFLDRFFYRDDGAGPSVEGYPGAQIKRFNTRQEAKKWYQTHYLPPTPPQLPAITFTAPALTSPKEIFIYADGACLHNGSKRVKGGFGVWWGPGDPRFDVSLPNVRHSQADRFCLQKPVGEVPRTFNKQQSRTECKPSLSSHVGGGACLRGECCRQW